MDTTSTPQTGKFGKIDDESNAMELLDKYGTSLFVDAIESSRLDRDFRNAPRLAPMQTKLFGTPCGSF